ncbi:MAG: Ribonuclease HII [bacterium ADurb.Bin400]|nr:MAG: Ribonuclease HII [bacterium ADurb.Bin400]
MTNNPPTFDMERSIQSEMNITTIAGVDEVGRGALAGPLVAAAVVFSNYNKMQPLLAGVTDSKKLTAQKRQSLSTTIMKLADDYALGIVASEEIDSIGIGQANILAFTRALDKLRSCNYALIDGRHFRGFSYPYQCVEKGDSISLSVAAASIIAKVYRDHLMEEWHRFVPEYGFDKNKGYGSAHHMNTLRRVGPSVYHRKSFLKFLSERNKLNLADKLL